MKEELDERESEILGIMFGDGSIYRAGRRASLKIEVTGHKVEDRDYLLGHVAPLFLDVFGLEMKPYYKRNENTMRIYAYSRDVAMKLHSWGMPIGPKKNAILLPRVEVVLMAFVRGLFDTDGCVYRKYGPYVQLQFKSISRELMAYTRALLVEQGLHPTKIVRDETRYKFYICRQEEVRAFFRDLVRPANVKHLRRLRAICGRLSFGVP